MLEIYKRLVLIGDQGGVIVQLEKLTSLGTHKEVLLNMHVTSLSAVFPAILCNVHLLCVDNCSQHMLFIETFN